MPLFPVASPRVDYPLFTLMMVSKRIHIHIYTQQHTPHKDINIPLYPNKLHELP